MQFFSQPVERIRCLISDQMNIISSFTCRSNSQLIEWSFVTLLFKVKLVTAFVEKKRLRNDQKKDILKTIRKCPELRKEMMEQLKRCDEEEEKDAEMMAMEFKINAQQAMQGSN